MNLWKMVYRDIEKSRENAKRSYLKKNPISPGRIDVRKEICEFKDCEKISCGICKGKFYCQEHYGQEKNGK